MKRLSSRCSPCTWNSPIYDLLRRTHISKVALTQPRDLQGPHNCSWHHAACTVTATKAVILPAYLRKIAMIESCITTEAATSNQTLQSVWSTGKPALISILKLAEAEYLAKSST